MNIGKDSKSHKPTILYVEDDFISHELVRLYLGPEYGYIISESVEDAKEQLKKTVIDLILIDLSLKGEEDGLDLIKYLRKSKKWQSLPAIAITAHAFIADREKCLKAGCNDYMSKPILKDNLLNKVNQYL